SGLWLALGLFSFLLHSQPLETIPAPADLRNRAMGAVVPPCPPGFSAFFFQTGWRPSGRLLVSPLHHLRTAEIPSKRWGPPQTPELEAQGNHGGENYGGRYQAG